MIVLTSSWSWDFNCLSRGRPNGRFVALSLQHVTLRPQIKPCASFGSHLGKYLALTVPNGGSRRCHGDEDASLLVWGRQSGRRSIHSLDLLLALAPPLFKLRPVNCAPSRYPRAVRKCPPDGTCQHLIQLMRARGVRCFDCGAELILEFGPPEKSGVLDRVLVHAHDRVDRARRQVEPRERDRRQIGADIREEFHGKRQRGQVKNTKVARVARDL